MTDDVTGRPSLASRGDLDAQIERTARTAVNYLVAAINVAAGALVYTWNGWSGVAVVCGLNVLCAVVKVGWLLWKAR